MSEDEKTWTPQEIAAQLKKPEGAGGVIVADNMQLANAGLYEMIFNELKAHNPHSLLEIGFGNGAHFQNYFNFFPDLDLTGVDFSNTMCNAAKSLNNEQVQNGKLTIICCDSRSLPNDKDTFDAIIAVNTVYFWDPVLQYVKEIKRILKPGGRLLLGYRPTQTMDQMEFTNYGFNKYDKTEISDILFAAGFSEVIQIENSYERIPVLGEKVKNTDIVAICKK